MSFRDLSRSRIWPALLLGVASLAQAHFVWVVPDKDGSHALLILSETLSPTAEVDVNLIQQTNLRVREGDGTDKPLPTPQSMKNAFAVSIPTSASQTRVIYGTADLGMLQHGQNRPSVLLYHPKTILGDAFAKPIILGGDMPVELVPKRSSGGFVLELLVHNQPEKNAEVTVVLPDGSQRKLKTNDFGQTETLSQTGRIGAWARFWEPVGGDRDGKHFEETRHYATLVFDTDSPYGNAPVSTSSQRVANHYGSLPEATSSFGQVVNDGWLYVYGGHVAATHHYATTSVSGHFARLNLKDGKTWEDLPAGPALQGMNLAVYDGKIYRIGGMEPHNKPGETQATFSTAECARFDPATKTWQPLPPLAEARSSHDVVTVGSKLIVVGGWDLQGSHGQTWADNLQILDVSSSEPKWIMVPQPFKRRALMAVSDEKKMYVLGGMDERGEIVHSVSIFDPATNQWSAGPDLPGGEINGFSPAAAAHEGQVFVSLADGSVYRLDSAQGQWVLLGTGTPRVAHRLAYWDNTVLISGGAMKGNNFDLIESLPAR